MSSLKDKVAALPLEDLVELQVEITKLISQKQIEQKVKLAEKFKKLAEQSGLNLSDIVWDEQEKANKKPERKKKKYHPKYYNPENPEQTWTGLGMKPRWVRALLEQGKTMEDLLIPAKD